MTVEAAPERYVGQAIRRKEDPRLITGRATYTDDLTMPGLLYAAIVRSPEAHARITSIDAEEARQQPGVQAVFTGDDLTDVVVMRRVGLAIATANARPEVKRAAHYITSAAGGQGAIREVAELLLQAHSRWSDILKKYEVD